MPFIEVKIPSMGESIASGILAKWHVKNGDIVKKDQPIFELETDKITSEGTSEAAGEISLKVAAGNEVKIGQVVATIDPDASSQKSDINTKPVASSALSIENQKSKIGNTPSPAVRRLAAESGVDPATVAGSGKAGRVTKGDMLAAAKRGGAGKRPEATGERPESAKPSLQPIPSPTAEPPPSPATSRQTRRKLTPLRARIAERLVAAQRDSAMLTTFNEADMSAVIALRAKYQEDFVKKNGIKLGFMSFFIKAIVHALKEVPAINAQLDGDTLIENHYYDIGVAVSTERGLMVPVIRDCDSLDMAAVEKFIVEAATKARNGKITLPDLEGGVFTITNGGVFGSLLSTPIINPPQSAILGLHAIQERPIAVNGQVVIRPMMYIALSYDHRIVDGREAVTFLVKVKQAIEDPARLLIGT
ncbi:MAG: 2-oxoglutarate dehydrogenase complex dihydrolipoyllysine-residue succinyltransferase [Verrucomicrobiota bacterium]|nr:2-oxoglutarate dehydrogenase complex dihydrolipoyllysine-residue succinyltransferase [Verrucomicrobiota bacterium]